jgi:hypothetical protein
MPMMMAAAREDRRGGRKGGVGDGFWGRVVC